MSFSITSVSLPTGETPVCGVTLEPFVRCRWGDNKTSNNLSVLEEFPVETALIPASHSLRYRWLRSPFTSGEGQMCHIHPDRPATIQCTIWSKLNYPVAFSYHCSVECFKQHWHLQKQYYEKALLGSQGENDRIAAFLVTQFHRPSVSLFAFIHFVHVFLFRTAYHMIQVYNANF